MACELCNFYKYSLKEIKDLDHRDFTMLFYGMQQIEAKRCLRSFNVSDYPTLKQDERSKLHRNMYKVAYPEDFVKRAVKTDDLVLI